jgi:Ca-activated chloride channel family protein
MTQHDYDRPRGPETRLTDYLFGELSDAEARALEAELAASAELRARLEELRATFALWREEAPAGAALAPERRAALRAEAAAGTPRGGLLRFPVWARAAAALVAVAGFVVLLKQAANPAPGARAADSAALSALGYTGDASDGRRAGAPSAAYPTPFERESRRGGAAPAHEGAAGEVARGLWKADAPALERAFEDGGLHVLKVEENLTAVADPFVGFAASTPATPITPPTSAPPAESVPPPAAPADRSVVGLGGSAGVEESKLSTLGYAGAGNGADDPDFDVEIAQAAARGFDLADGYGRNYHGREVIQHLRRHGRETPRDMFYRYYGDNPRVRASEDPLSTFATDVDTASWALLRNYLVQGHLPPKAAVRTEECVNAFRQELAAPAEQDFAIHLEAAPTPFAPDGSLLLRVGLKAREVSRAARKPLNLVFVVDKSGSMASQNRMELVKNSLELLVDQIRDDDTIGIVTFDSNGHELLQPTAGAERWKIREALRGLATGGSTNAGEGLALGYAMAERAFRKEAVNRVVLASDGVANTGQTDQAAILADVRKRAERDVDLTTIGVGMGNHNDIFLERLADDGDGSCHYVDTLEEAKRVLVDGFTGAMQVVAREARVQVEFSPGTVREWRQLGYENRALRDEDFRNDAVDAGEIGAGHEMVALYELRPTEIVQGPDTLATIRLRWKPDGAQEFVEIERKISLAEVRARWELATPRFRLAGSVAQFAEFLRRSVHARGDSYDELRGRAAGLARELRDDAQVAEFRDLVDRTAALASRLWPDDELALLIEEARRLRLTECELESLPQRSDKVEELLIEVRLQNEALERRLEELLQPR